MHIPARPRQAPILTGRGQPQGSAGPEARELAAALRQRLDPERWPVPPEALPAGTALVGGAVRDGLLGRLAEKPDLDLVVPADDDPDYGIAVHYGVRTGIIGGH